MQFFPKPRYTYMPYIPYIPYISYTYQSTKENNQGSPFSLLTCLSFPDTGGGQADARRKNNGTQASCPGEA